MKIIFDTNKDQLNQAKHGLSLSFAAQLNWDTALIWVDERYDYDEVRMIALAPKTNTVYYVAFTENDDLYRIISLRKATRKEALHYVNQT